MNAPTIPRSPPAETAPPPRPTLPATPGPSARRPMHVPALAGWIPRAEDATCDDTTDSAADPDFDGHAVEDGQHDRRHTHLVIFGLTGHARRVVGHHVANRLHRPFVDASSLSGSASDDDRADEPCAVDAGKVRHVLGLRNAVVLATGRTALDTTVVPELADAVVVDIGRPDERLGHHIADAHIDASTGVLADLVERVIDAWESAAD